MIKQKKGFWLFLFSLIPGAGELYMGFKKQGVSLMLFFWGTIAIAFTLNLGILCMLLPILWFYSFFNVHNLKSLSDEEFYMIEDDYAFHLDKLIADKEIFIKKYRTFIGVVLILCGLSLLWNILYDILYYMLPEFLIHLLNNISYSFVRGVVGLGIIYIGIALIRGKRKELEMHEDA